MSNERLCNEPLIRQYAAVRGHAYRIDSVNGQKFRPRALFHLPSVVPPFLNHTLTSIPGLAHYGIVAHANQRDLL